MEKIFTINPKNFIFSTLFFLITFTTIAQQDPFSGGTGTSQDPYLIENRAQLDSIRNRLGPSNANIYYKLIEDIDLGSSPWHPIGTYISSTNHTKSFCGKIYGNNKKIKNINIGQENEPVTYQYTGLFGYLYDGAYIENLHIESGNIKGSVQPNSISYTGSFAGFAYNYSQTITIINCTNKSDVSIPQALSPFAGGFVGYAYGRNIDIQNCINYGNIESGNENAKIGGIIGERFSQSATEYEIKNCTNYGEITENGTDNNIGGIIGKATTVQVSNCVHYGNVYANNDNNNAGAITGYGQTITYTNNSNHGYVGGIGNDVSVGGITGTGTLSNFIDNINYGEISANGYPINAGGIIGNGNGLEITGCTNYGYISGVRALIGGILGNGEISVSNSNTTIKKCINLGILSSSGTNARLGGIAGNITGDANNNITIEECINLGDIYAGPEENLRVGGIISTGYNNIIIKNSYNYANIFINWGHYSYVGGIAGSTEGNTGEIIIENTYSFGSVIANGVITYTGNIAGNNQSLGATIKNSLGTSLFIFGSEYCTFRIIGRDEGGILINNYADSLMKVIYYPIHDFPPEAGHMSQIGTSGKNGKDIKREKLYKPETYRDFLPEWDFNNVWSIRNDNVHLPYLKWQSAPVVVNEASINSVSLNAYSDLDSVCVYRYRTREHMHTIRNIRQGEGHYGMFLPDTNPGDSIAFYSYESGKKTSYPEIYVFNPVFSGGNGTEESPYEIKTRFDLEYLNNYLGIDNNNHENHYKVMNTIDLSGLGWTPIGYDLDNSFRGKLHGNNQKITGINIGQDDNQTHKYTGLFGYISAGAYIDSLHIEGGIINGSAGEIDSYTGSIVGIVRNQVITDSINIIGCTNSAVVNGSGQDNSYTGGIAGFIFGSKINMIDCANHGIVSSGTAVGGIIGSAQNSNMNFLIRDCVNYGDLNGNSCIGGITGLTIANIENSVIYIENCFNNGNIYGENQNQVVIGGITGIAQNNIYVKDCYSHSDITQHGDNACIGGISGITRTDNQIFYLCTFENTYSSGNISSYGTNGSLGGLFGSLEGANTILRNSVSAINSIVYYNNAETNHLIGKLENMTNDISNNYSNSGTLFNSVTISPDPYDPKQGTGRTLAELQSRSTYDQHLSSWDFQDIWELRSDNLKLPFFKWQASPVLVQDVYRNSMTIDMYRNNDSLLIFSFPSYNLERELYSLTSGMQTPIVDFRYKNAGDTIIFINYENNKKWRSYSEKAVIQPNNITVTAIPKYICFGSDEINLTYTVSPSLISGDILYGEPEREPGTTPGEYIILQGTLNNDNYIINFEGSIYTIHAVPDIAFIDDKIVCSGTEIQAVELNSNTAGTVFHWTGGNGIGLANGSSETEIPAFTAVSNTVTEAIISVSPVKDYQFISCTGISEIFEITVNPTPTVNTIQNMTVCDNSDINDITLTGSVNGTDFYWTGGGVVGLSDGNSLTQIPGFTATTFPENEITTAIIKVKPQFTHASLTCIGDYIEFVITVNPIPTVNAVEDITVCNNIYISDINLSGNISGTDFYWTGGTDIGLLNGNSISGIPGFTATGAQDEIKTAVIVVTPRFTNNMVTCSGDNKDFSITVNPVPVVSAISDYAVCDGEELPDIQLTGNVDGIIFHWTGGSEIGLEDSQSNSKIPSFTPDVNEEKTSIITVIPEFTNNNVTCTGNSTNFSITIAYPVEIISQPYKPIEFCFSDLSFSIPIETTGSIVSYKWYKNNRIVNEQNNSTLYISYPEMADTGIYRVEITGKCNSVSSSETEVRFMHNPDGLIEQKWNNVLFVSDKNQEFEKSGYQWYKNGIEIPGATLQYYSAGENETDLLDFDAVYSVKIPLKNTENSYIYTCPASFESRRSVLSVHPNPVQKGNELNIILPEEFLDTDILIGIYSLTGQLISDFRTSENQINFPVNLESGTYIIKINSGNFNKSIKVNVL
ncbi:MAG: T9SS type A sorting domain-containing protein [Bacteroidales bacterium]|jgi:hypothetical protein|nr:T9SS type A sorting domain-containing protein [Bacteroidales bacterium]